MCCALCAGGCTIENREAVADPWIRLNYDGEKDNYGMLNLITGRYVYSRNCHHLNRVRLRNKGNNRQPPSSIYIYIYNIYIRFVDGAVTR